MSPARKPRRVALYARVSTDDQTVEKQLRELREVAQRRGWEVVAEYTDRGVSGAKGRDQRPGLDRMLKAMTRGEVDTIAAWSVDRLGRSLRHLLDTLGELQACGCDLYLHRQGLDTATPAGRAMFQMLGVFSEFERAMIQERVKAGMARAKKDGKAIGRPKDDSNAKAILAARKKGHGKLRIARELGCGVSTVQRVLAEAGAA